MMVMMKKYGEYQLNNSLTGSDALYRFYGPPCVIKGNGFRFEVPSKVRVWHEGNRWLQHPVVMKNASGGEVIIFLLEGSCIRVFLYDGAFPGELYEDAKHQGLTRGKRDGLARLVHEEK